jgi:hypothetical protein
MSYPIIPQGTTGQAEFVQYITRGNLPCEWASLWGIEDSATVSSQTPNNCDVAEQFPNAYFGQEGWYVNDGNVTVPPRGWLGVLSALELISCENDVSVYKHYVFIVVAASSSSSSSGSSQSSSSAQSSLTSDSSQQSSTQSSHSQASSGQSSGQSSLSSTSSDSSQSSASSQSSSSSSSSSCSSMSSSNTSLSSGCCTEMAFGIQRIIPWCDYHTCDFGEPGLTTFINDTPIPNALWLLELQEGGDAKVTAGLIPNDLMDESFITDVDLYFRPEDPEDPTKSNGEVYHYCVKVKYGAAPHNPCPPAMQSVDEAQDFFLEY